MLLLSNILRFIKPCIFLTLGCIQTCVNCVTKCVMAKIYPLKIKFQAFPILFSKHRPSGPMLSTSGFVRLSVRLYVCPSVRLSVCLCVCSLLRYRLTVFLPPLPEAGCPIFLEIRNPWGKVMERSGLRYEHVCLKIV